MVAKKKATKTTMSAPSSPDRSENLRIEKISNGYLAHHSCMDGKGNYSHKTVYHQTPPKITITAEPTKPKK